MEGKEEMEGQEGQGRGEKGRKKRGMEGRWRKGRVFLPNEILATALLTLSRQNRSNGHELWVKWINKSGRVTWVMYYCPQLNLSDYKYNINDLIIISALL